jgi:ketosteroid isomerase-like protein
VSQENVELYYRAINAFNRRDFDAFLALMDADVESAPRVASVEGRFHGHDGVRRWWQNLLAAFPDYTAEILEVHDLGDHTLAAVRTRGHGAGSETPLDQRMWQVGRWRRGKCVSRETFETKAEALKAAGLSEQDAHADS